MTLLYYTMKLKNRLGGTLRFPACRLPAGRQGRQVNVTMCIIFFYSLFHREPQSMHRETQRKNHGFYKTVFLPCADLKNRANEQSINSWCRSGFEAYG